MSAKPQDSHSAPDRRARSGGDGSSHSEFDDCVRSGGVAVFPTDTVYGLACDAENPSAVERLYELKQRELSKPSAVMFASVAAALAALPELGPRSRAAIEVLLPGPITLLLPNPARRYSAACGNDHETLGLRVPVLPEAVGDFGGAILQSSANIAGGPDPLKVTDIPLSIREHVQLVIDAGELPGTPSTVIDLTAYEEDKSWKTIRHGATTEEEITHSLLLVCS